MVVSNTLRVCFGAALLIAAACGVRPLSAQVEPIAPANYRICVGDVFEVSVTQHPELSRRVAVRGDGNHILTVSGVEVSHPSKMDGVLRNLKVVGLSASDVAASLRTKLETAISKPQVTVTLVEFIAQPQPPSTRPSPQLQDTPPPSPSTKPAQS